MFKYIVLVMLTSFSACSSKDTSQEVKTFVKSYQDQFGSTDPEYVKVYERYLASVEKIYKKHDKKKEFRSYLDSLNNNSQILSDQASALPELYKQQTGQAVNDNNKQPYMLFRTSQMTSLSDKLFSAHELKIKAESGDEFYEKLRTNYAHFMDKENAHKFGFPL